MGITFESISKVEELFNAKNWEIINDSSLFSSTFNRFCARLAMFDEEKQDLLIELGYRFTDLNLNDFQPCFVDAIKKIENLDEYKSIIVAPLKSPNTKSVKSCDGIWYHLKNYSDFSYETFGKKLYFSSDWEKNTKVLDEKKGILLILIDDFIGTGETVVGALDDLFSEGIIKTEHKIKVLTFMAQREGVEVVHKKYPKIVTHSISLDKGLTDNYKGDNLANNKKLMTEMEQKLKVHSDYEFGYGRSESLVAVSRRSANNTFPVFWLEKKTKLAPFKR